MESGEPVYTDWITHNPDGLSMQQAMGQYNRSAVGGGPMIQTYDYAKQYFWRPQQQLAMEVWSQNDSHNYCMPNFIVADEYAAEYAKIGADIATYVAESRVKFVNGDFAMDDFENVYIPTLKEMGLDRYLEIIQEACDRFYAR